MVDELDQYGVTLKSIAKDLYKGDLLEAGLGAYVTQEYESLFGGHFAPRVGVGLDVRF